MCIGHVYIVMIDRLYGDFPEKVDFFMSAFNPSIYVCLRSSVVKVRKLDCVRISTRE